MADPRQTPAMRQFYRFKERYPDCVLLFRMGDFYETFDDDAVTVSKALGLTLTRRAEGVPMAGVPFHQLESYLGRLIRAGFRVAVCDQVQDPKDAKGIVDRAVTRVVTPGTLVDETLLDDAAPSCLAAVLRRDDRVALAVVEASTGHFMLADGAPGELVDLLASRAVREVLHPDDADEASLRAVVDSLGIALTPRPAWQFRPDEARESLLKQYGVASLSGFGLADDDPALQPAGAIVRYLHETQATDQSAPNTASSRAAQFRPRPASLSHLAPPRRENPADYCVLDAVSLRALEVERTIRSGQLDGSLLGLFLVRTQGGCRTPMGKRLVREWLCRPLARLDAIRARHRAVATLVEDRRTADALGDALDGVQDVARIAGRLAVGRATPRDVVALGRSLARLDRIAETLANAPAFADHLDRLAASRCAIAPVAARVLDQCVDDPPGHLREGGLFRDGVDPALDEARLLQRDASSWLASYQARLTAEHDLPSLKVGFNKVFGYYIELPAAQAKRAPAAFSRKQTLTKAERYITPELKEFEDKVTTADARAVEREHELFDALCAAAAAEIPAIAEYARCVAELDVLGCFADRALRRAWCRPEMSEGPVLTIRQGRHPVLEELLGDGFVPNDLALGLQKPGAAQPSDPAPQEALPPSTASLALITGPNMAGKSTFIRQTALIALLAHAGSFVPAQGAVIGLADRIFTRVGADDALHSGQSTFLVEMIETANILNNAGPRSLIILDEIGRGTSTLDGLSLAWAIAEHLAAAPGASGSPPRTLFATHYHELTELEDRLPGRVMNLHVSVREWGDQIIFLHRILPGRTDRSYGLHVARLAGIPGGVVGRAREVLDSLAVHHHPATGQAKAPLLTPLSATRGPTRTRRPDTGAIPAPPDGQLALFTEFLPHPALDALRELKLDALSPIQAFDALRRLKEQVDKP